MMQAPLKFCSFTAPQIGVSAGRVDEVLQSTAWMSSVLVRPEYSLSRVQ